jgi:hypothetical protein
VVADAPRAALLSQCSRANRLPIGIMSHGGPVSERHTGVCQVPDKPIEKVRHADLVSFTGLKAFALDQRHEPKDAYDIIYCPENAEGGLEAAATKFRDAREGRHRKVIKDALAILRKRFADDGTTQGCRKDGPVAVTQFEIDGEAEEVRERRLVRQRAASDLVMRFLKAMGAKHDPRRLALTSHWRHAVHAQKPIGRAQDREMFVDIGSDLVCSKGPTRSLRDG